MEYCQEHILSPVTTILDQTAVFQNTLNHWLHDSPADILSCSLRVEATLSGSAAYLVREEGEDLLQHEVGQEHPAGEGGRSPGVAPPLLLPLPPQSPLPLLAALQIFAAALFEFLCHLPVRDAASKLRVANQPDCPTLEPHLNIHQVESLSGHGGVGGDRLGMFGHPGGAQAAARQGRPQRPHGVPAVCHLWE